MHTFRSLRLMILALLIGLIPASSRAGVFISVGFAPPVLPVYVQPPCPQAGLMWTPGYWGYGPDGYYWVPGAWVPAPYAGALWTPGYWGWSAGLYVWHPGYWGPHVGYYGGVNYGFGYMGIGFVGGVWHGGVFAYNTAVMHVNTAIIHTTYVDRTIVERNTIVNDRHVAFSGGPGGIQHAPTPQERLADHDQHIQRTAFQAQHENAAMHDRTAYARNTGGHPEGNFSHGEPNHPAGETRNAPRPEERSAPRQQEQHPQGHQQSAPHNQGHEKDGHDK
jgi:WXXGXW repeat (2 copies)